MFPFLLLEALFFLACFSILLLLHALRTFPRHLTVRWVRASDHGVICTDIYFNTNEIVPWLFKRTVELLMCAYCVSVLWRHFQAARGAGATAVRPKPLGGNGDAEMEIRRAAREVRGFALR